MKKENIVFVLIHEPRGVGGYDEYEGNDFEILGVFKSKEKCEEVIEKNIKNYHYSCHITRDNYTIEEKIVIEDD